jgi:ABC-type bacteriocin/lantibiotic exporter with double-glycine peptidase domain
MDEATSALDNETERSVNAMLRQLKQAHPGLTIVVIAHRESTLAYCDRIIRL